MKEAIVMCLGACDEPLETIGLIVITGPVSVGHTEIKQSTYNILYGRV
jgi:hypothetical protein